MSETNKLPSGIPYIIGNEAAERYSFYGMKAILVVFMTQYMLNAAGEPDRMSSEDAKFWYHTFVAVSYYTPFLGAILADVFWGKYKTIMRLSIVYVIGHFILALWETKMGLFAGCAFIALGAGGIKPCVSAHVGDQFTSAKGAVFERVYLWFYLAINAGAVIAYLTAERILSNEWLTEMGLNSRLAFGIPGVLMAVAVVIFWMGRNSFISVKPAGPKKWAKEFGEWLPTILKLVPLYLFLAVFFALFDQTGSAWVIQAQSDLMDKTINLGFTSFQFLPSEIGFFNPLLIVLMIPIFTYALYPWLRGKIPLPYTTKMAIGFFIAVLSFGLIAWVQSQMDAGITMSIQWQILGFLLLTASEILVSITALEFSYTQAPNKLKSFIMSFYLFSVALGNTFVSIVNKFIIREDGTNMLEGASYFWFFTILMLVASLIFLVYAYFYTETMIIQDEADYE